MKKEFFRWEVFLLKRTEDEKTSSFSEVLERCKREGRSTLLESQRSKNLEEAFVESLQAAYAHHKNSILYDEEVFSKWKNVRGWYCEGKECGYIYQLLSQESERGEIFFATYVFTD